MAMTMAAKQKKLIKAYEDCIKMMDKIHMDYGYITEVTVNTRAKTRWGQCRKRFAKGDYYFTINISEMLLEPDVPEKALHNTIIHEILHTCPDCFNHGAEWKRRAEQVNRTYGYNVKRCASAEENGVDRSLLVTKKANYMLRCTGCGQEIKRDRISNLIRYPQMYKCGRCGCEFKRIL